MLRKKPRHWWQRRRVWLGLWGVLVIVVLVVAFVRSNHSAIVVYNETGFPLPPLAVIACGQEISVSGIAAEASKRIRLQESGTPSDLQIEILAADPLHWEGGYVEPIGGYRIEVRVLPDLSFQFGSQISIWRRWKLF